MRYKTCACGGSNKKCKVCSGWGIFPPAQNAPVRSSKKRLDLFGDLGGIEGRNESL